MRRLAIALATLAIALGAAPAAAPHQSGYCAHATYSWTFYPSGGHPIYYKEVFQAGWGAGPHYHEYRTWYRTAGSDVWIPIHFHTRLCKSHYVL